MNLSRNGRSVGSIGMLVLLASALTPANALAELTPGQLAALAASAFSSPSTAAVARAARELYYATRYDNENGPYTTYDEAIRASQYMLWNAVHLWMQGDSNLEQGLLISRDQYGQYWHLTPRVSLDHRITLYTSEVKRPNSTVVAMAHSHPEDTPSFTEVFPEGSGGDNLTGYDQFVQRFGGDIWYYRPNTHEPKLYGAIQKGSDGNPVLSTKYAGFDSAGNPNVAKLPQNVDLYELDKKSGGDGSKVWWDRYTKGPLLLQIVLVPVAVGVFSLIVLFSGGSGGGTLEGIPSPSPGDLVPGW